MRSVYDAIHEVFRDSVRDFLKRHVVPNIGNYAAERGFPCDLWRAVGAQGYLGLNVPEQYGGSSAGDYRFNAVLLEELAKVNLALASSLSIHFDVVAPYLVRLASERQRAEWLPKFVAGELITAIGMTEPSAGSDLAALRTSATSHSDGGWLVNGSKTFITNGGSADLVVVAVRTTPGTRSRGISLVAVESGMAGFSRGGVLDKVGQAEADTSELFFDDVHVPATHLIGELDRGFGHMMSFLSQERLGTAVANLAHARQILDETLDYVRQRRAFGKPIGSFQYNKFLLADLVTRVEITQAYVDQCVALHSDEKLTAVDAAKAKWWVAEVQNHVLDNCLQLHGGYGYMNEYRVARAWRDARITKIWAGSNEVMKELIGRDLGL
ncbi:acyl-CoA dehydrogenase family protein [Nocardia salmonicida]|uniref:acyl-CoA dehydrogenase family protein n=1 Tax=Nocardia salmonicida TaxID=53431 RepID=UPI00366E3087